MEQDLIGVLVLVAVLSFGFSIVSRLNQIAVFLDSIRVDLEDICGTMK
jgi:hypothetical protein